MISPDWKLVTWTGIDSRRLRTYEVLYAPAPDGPYEQLNKAEMLSTTYLHIKDRDESDGVYKVRAVDYWGRSVE